MQSVTDRPMDDRMMPIAKESRKLAAGTSQAQMTINTEPVSRVLMRTRRTVRGRNAPFSEEPLAILLPRDANAERGDATVSRPSVCPSVRDVQVS